MIQLLKYEFSEYVLTQLNQLNSSDTGNPLKGALVKISDEEENWGVADLMPWENLGDASLKNELIYKGPLFQRACELALEDLQARKNKVSLLKDVWINNNKTIVDFKNFEMSNQHFSNQQNNNPNSITVLKIKGDKNWIELIDFILKIIDDVLALRIDFNGCLNINEFDQFVMKLTSSNYWHKIAKKIQYIEDPVKIEMQREYSQLDLFNYFKKWNALIPIAQDFCNFPFDFISFKINKPSRENLQNDLINYNNITCTSSMGHPVGLAHDLRIVQNYLLIQNSTSSKNHFATVNSVCGFLTNNLFEKTQFHDFFIYQNTTQINFSKTNREDFGIGMSEELMKLNWQICP